MHCFSTQRENKTEKVFARGYKKKKKVFLKSEVSSILKIWILTSGDLKEKKEKVDFSLKKECTPHLC